MTSSGANDFAIDLFQQLRGGAGNLLVSPLSIRVALAMAEIGSRGASSDELRCVLHAASADDRAAIASTLRRLNAAGADQFDLTVANALWCQSGQSIEPGFLEAMRAEFGASPSFADFAREAEVARSAMNRWVEEQTRQKITHLISPGAINGDTRLVLLNAVYFKGKWDHPFVRAQTKDEPFYLDDGTTTSAPLMYQKHDVWHVHADGFQAIDLFYTGGTISMLFILPDQRDGLSALEQRLSASVLNSVVKSQRETEVKIFIPRFRIMWGARSLLPALEGLGLARVFSPADADFSGINNRTPPDPEALFISEVLHKAFADVNEEGTEAAAATAMFMAPTMSLAPPPPIPVFRADHPFLFAIRDRQSGDVLFIGRVSDPTRES